jgi:hypothetical protein
MHSNVVCFALGPSPAHLGEGLGRAQETWGKDRWVVRVIILMIYDIFGAPELPSFLMRPSNNHQHLPNESDGKFSHNAQWLRKTHSLCVMQFYALFGVNRKRWTQKLCIMRIMHYELMHYENFNCSKQLWKVHYRSLTQSLYRFMSG